MKSKRYLIVSLLILFFCCPYCFCDSSLPFKLTHFIGNPNSSGSFEFWVPGTRENISSADVTSYLTQGRFATLGVRYSGTFQIASLEISFSDLRRYSLEGGNKEFYADCCPYELRIYDAKNSDTLLINPSDYSSVTGNGGASAVIFENGKSWTAQSNQEADAVADFYIAIDTDSAMAGTFEGTITVTIGGS